MAHHRRNPSIASFNDMENPSLLRSRKMSTGGNRSWSEEEETYLLQTRMQKMPYKHIAQHLKKTELACRLHFHQLSHGSHRRKRNASISSSGTGVSMGSTADNSPRSQFSLPNDLVEEPQNITPPRQQTPMTRQSPMHPTHVDMSPAQQQKIILPRLHPRLITPQQSPEPRAALRVDASVGNPRPGYPFHHHGFAPAGMQPMRMSNPSSLSMDSRLSDSRSHSPMSSVGPIDTARLRSIYEAHRSAFWATIAADYGPDVSAAQLEDIWKRGGMKSPLVPNVGMGIHVPRPPTPPEAEGVSPMESGRQLHAPPAPARWASVNSADRRPLERTLSEQSVPVAALLTEDRNPR
ncbi:hypothetical protein HDK90DRAFT_195370 [Phyllosticta capitalensis]|uniref:Myb-like domain-containing protein n=1 Tax=Phyllosticta capitalensis TaxID=121624 RepID=A0ABR1YX39_9PEZI